MDRHMATACQRPDRSRDQAGAGAVGVEDWLPEDLIRRGEMKRRSLAVAVACLAWVLGSASPSWAPHLYRGPGGGCTPNDGALSDGGTGTIGATVMMLHNTFNDSETLGPVTFIEAGQAVTWTWNSAHCHSAKSADVGGFYTGYYYPAPVPSSPQAVPGFF